jgi:ubiquinone/menaquinone biosynthesis C-methylase UbiE
MDSLKLINSKTREAYNLVAFKYHVLFHNEMQEKEYDRKFLDEFSNRFNKDSVILDTGCGPSGHIGRYIFDKGIKVIGIDISDKCVELAQKKNPLIKFFRQDMTELEFENNVFDGIISYYSVIDTPKKYVHKIFNEFQRVLKPSGYLLVVVKAGTNEGYINQLLGIKTTLYFTLFSKKEITNYFEQAGFSLEFIEQRNPYNFEINNDRIFTIGRKV